MTHTITSLANVSELWLNPNHPLRIETVKALQVSTGFSQRQIDMAIDNCFEELSLPKLTAYAQSLKPARKSRTVIHILPSNAFTAWVHGAVTSLLLDHTCLLKPSAREPIFAQAWIRSMQEVAPELALQVGIVHWDPTSLTGDETIVAYGSDETLTKICEALPKGTTFAGYGHKLSVGIVFAEALGADNDVLIGNVIKDAEPFRLQGCLSPQILYVQRPDWSRWPELDAQLFAPPRIRSFREPEELAEELKKFVPHLSCVGFAGAVEAGENLRNLLAGYRVSRICPIGQMQRPPLDWENGGIKLADLLN